ncbi:hypothetical protein P154DRAFT_519115 [Amniculicola lignicola CBS 123094]|uniref:Uncharacterized protein n=1 Tax=Amniculicola lignicola CBS 123094 TaxID=1392246 RepID=A0A6A5WUI7_9PLEO|nr:hypothetical protein P154DRAFT_519115 [Amniculicola lignicola CBS 123094]
MRTNLRVHNAIRVLPATQVYRIVVAEVSPARLEASSRQRPTGAVSLSPACTPRLTDTRALEYTEMDGLRRSRFGYLCDASLLMRSLQPPDHDTGTQLLIWRRCSVQLVA